MYTSVSISSERLISLSPYPLRRRWHVEVARGRTRAGHVVAHLPLAT